MEQYDTLENRVTVTEKQIALQSLKLDNVEHNSKDWWKDMSSDLSELKKQVSAIPDEVIKRLNETMDLKIKAQVQDLETRMTEKSNATYKWIIGLTVGVVISLAGMIVSFLK
ncbi:MAG: hypothetical protein M0R51_10080 [Clostridia bacterium]|jgi:uncharacterized protein YajQ (UPF0234 family)|nr:hypothetical protein [Clostridia bacterium]